jgi:hypothetical protein
MAGERTDDSRDAKHPARHHGKGREGKNDGDHCHLRPPFTLRIQVMGSGLAFCLPNGKQKAKGKT